MGKYQPKEVAEVKRFIKKGAEFMFIPSPKLVEMVAKNEHMLVKKLPEVFKCVLLENKPIHIEGELALDYYDGVLDDDNSFILDNGDIKIIPTKININDFNK
ncbi:MAG TPA: hypothetical protein VMZ91_02125 [Candidatus Paceibacterota bacterium]|nr:hypothetical protein [Candidatus Paceibacterota bacterium]